MKDSGKDPRTQGLGSWTIPSLGVCRAEVQPSGKPSVCGCWTLKHLGAPDPTWAAQLLARQGRVAMGDTLPDSPSVLLSRSEAFQGQTLPGFSGRREENVRPSHAGHPAGSCLCSCWLWHCPVEGLMVPHRSHVGGGSLTSGHEGEGAALAHGAGSPPPAPV